MPHLESRGSVRLVLAFFACLTVVFLSACDHAKDLVEQGKKQAEDIQKNLEAKTETASASSSGDSSSAAGPNLPSAGSSLPVSPPEQPDPSPKPPPTDPNQLLESFSKAGPDQRNDAMLRMLAALPEEARARLIECNLSNGLVSDAGLLEIAKFPNLTRLNLADCKGISDSGLAALQDAKSLEVLILERCNVSDAGMNQLKGVTWLKVLNLNQTGVTDIGLSRLAPLSHLEELHILSTKVNGSAFRKVPWAGSLRVLMAGSTALGLDFEALQTYRNLEELNVFDSQVSDRSIGALKGHSKLRKLYLSKNAITDIGAKKLTGLGNLEDISLRGTAISDKCLATFKICKNLKHFGEGETMVTAAGRDYIKKFAPECEFDSK